MIQNTADTLSTFHFEAAKVEWVLFKNAAWLGHLPVGRYEDTQRVKDRDYLDQALSGADTKSRNRLSMQARGNVGRHVHGGGRLRRSGTLSHQALRPAKPRVGNGCDFPAGRWCSRSAPGRPRRTRSRLGTLDCVAKYQPVIGVLHMAIIVDPF